MKPRLAALALIAVMGLSGVAAPHGALGAGASYYVNFDHGDDAADGRSPARAWRHAPGDGNAQGLPAHTLLDPGDTLLFAAGVHYRGQVKVNGGGEAGAPVVLTSAPGAAPAVIDGSDPAASCAPAVPRRTAGA